MLTDRVADFGWFLSLSGAFFVRAALARTAVTVCVFAVDLISLARPGPKSWRRYGARLSTGGVQSRCGTEVRT
jgi:hypothetical protein